MIQEPNRTIAASQLDAVDSTRKEHSNAKPAKLAIFALPKPFTDPHIDLIQKNAIRSWMALGSDVEVILMGDDDGVKEVAAELGTKHYAAVSKNEQGTPLLSDAFRAATQLSNADVLVYCNCDVILLNDLVASIEFVQDQDSLESFVAFGRRTDLDITSPIDFADQEQVTWLLNETKTKGKLAPVVCKEYFAFTRDQFRDVPEFAVGRGNWDNWMLAHAKSIGLPVIDFTEMVKVLHQNHDYSHVQANRQTSRLNVYVSGQEAKQNQRLAGGRNVIGGSTGTWSLTESGLRKNRMSWMNKRFWLDLPRFLKMVLRFPFQK